MKFIVILCVGTLLSAIVNLFQGDYPNMRLSLTGFAVSAALLGAYGLIAFLIGRARAKRAEKNKGPVPPAPAAPARCDPPCRRIAHISCLYDRTPLRPDEKQAVQSALVRELESRGYALDAQSRISFNNFGDASELSKPPSQCSTLKSLYHTYGFYGCSVEDMLSRTVLTLTMQAGGVPVYCHVMVSA